MRFSFQGPVSSGDLRDAQATRLNSGFPINITNFSVNFSPKVFRIPKNMICQINNESSPVFYHKKLGTQPGV
jgi:hypothetical protein